MKECHGPDEVGTPTSPLADTGQPDTTVAPNSGRRIGRRTLLRTGGVATLGLAVPSIVSAQDDEPTATWVFETDGAIGASSPTVVHDVVFVGSTDGHVYAIDAPAGSERWRYDVGSHIADSPSVVDDSLYVVDSEGTLHCHVAETGEPNWTYRHAFLEPISQTVAGGLVFCSTGADVIAVDAASGEEVWEFTDAFGASVASTPTVVDGVVYVGLGAASLFALDAADGSQLWQFEADAGGNVDSSPTVFDGTVYVGSADGNLYAVDAETGDQVWSASIASGISSSPTVHDGRVYVGTMLGGFDGGLSAVDARSGDEQWAVTFSGETVDRTSPTLADGVVYVGSDGFDSHLYAIDAGTGEELWRYLIDGWVQSSPTVVDGTVYVGARDGTVHAVDGVGSGSSDGSRVSLGTLGHHDHWSEVSPSVFVGDPATTNGAADSSGSDESDDTDPSDDDGDSTRDDSTQDDTEQAGFDPADDSDGLPGPGLVGALAAIGGGYAIAYWRHRNRE